MDHDIKVSTPASKGRDIFLRDDQLNGEVKPHVYSLEEEFAKTRKNRNYLLYASIGLFVAVLLGITWFVSAAIDERSKHVNISISDFEDIKLRELLNSAKGVEGQLNQKQQELADLRVALERELGNVKDRYNRKADLARDDISDPAERKAALDRIDADRRTDEDRVRAAYAGKIGEKEAEIETIRKSMSTYDQKLLASARKSENFMDNATKLQEIEMQKIRDYYEDKMREQTRDHEKEIKELRDYQLQLTGALISRYNPFYTGDTLKKALSNYSGQQAKLILRDFRSELSNDGVVTRQGFQNLRERLAAWQAIMDRMKQTPYTNSVPPALASMNTITVSLISDYEGLWYGLASSIERRDHDIERFRYAMSAYSRQRHENGFILDPRDPKAMLVYVDSLYPVKPGDTALVFRGDEEYIGKVRLYPDRDMFRAEVVEISNAIQPLDKVLLNYREKPANSEQ